MIPVSVVIPVYQHVGVLDRALESVAAQSVCPCEVIVVNDGGEHVVDEAVARLQKRFCRFGSNWLKMVSLPINCGAGSARNAGWTLARGSYIAFLDADDAWHPRKLEIQHKFMESHPDVILSGHAYRQETGEVDWRNYSLNTTLKRMHIWRMLLANQFVTPSAMIRRTCSMRFDQTQRHMEDYRLWLAVVASGATVIKLDAELACIFKPIFGSAGLSADLARMEIAELKTYWHLCVHMPALALLLPFLCAYSLAKFVRRCVLVISQRG